MENSYHSGILREIKKRATKKDKNLSQWLRGYLGTQKYCYLLRSADVRQIAKDFVRGHKDFSDRQWTDLLDYLYQGKSNEELAVAARIFGYLPEFKNKVSPRMLDKWLEKTEGWAEVDILCQSNFSEEEILDNWENWEKFLIKLSNDKNIHKRRASLVLLVKAAGHSKDKRVFNLAVKNIEKLKAEKEILITKAISWLLRALSENFHKEIAMYLDKNQDSLPKIAIRETRRKLETGIKNRKKIKLNKQA